MLRPPRRPSPNGHTPHQAPRTALRLEALEDRTLLSAPAPVPAYVASQILGQLQPAALSAEAANDAHVTGNPNDPQFPNQWGLLNTGQGGGTAGVDVHAVQAWTVTTGSPGVAVAEIDTGVDYNNADLYQNIWINQAEIPSQWYTKSSDGTFDKLVQKSQIVTATPGIITFADLNNAKNAGLVWDGNGDGRVDAGDLLRPLSQGGWDSGSTKDGDTAHPDDFFGWNFVANNNNPFDDNGHGTNVAGIIGATGNNGVGVAGVDWNLQLMDLKVFDANGAGSSGNIVAAIEYSIRHGAKISNNSWALYGASTDIFNAIADAQKAGQIVVVAAGNGGSNQPSYPALYTTQFTNMISVAAITNQGQLWSGSNYGGTSVTLAAPGVGIVSDAPGGGFVPYTGTSQATPFVTGTLALVWGLHPGWTYQQVIHQVTSTTTPLASLQGKTITGGLVNAAAAVGYVPPNGGGVPAPAPTPHVVSAVFSGPDAHSFNRIVVTFDQFVDPTTFTAANIHLAGPSGQTVALTAAKLAPGSDGHQFEVDFNTQTALGTYTLTLTSGVHGSLGGTLAAYSTTATLTPATYTFASTTAVTIPAYATEVSTITVNPSFAVAAVKVQLNITATQDGALYLYLQSPDGTQVVLSLGRGGAGQNFQNTLFDDKAAIPISAGAAPFTGSYRPEIPLSIFNGKNAAGVWKLSVQNRSGQTVGVLNGWSLFFTAAAPATSSTVAGAQTAGAPTQANTAPQSLPQHLLTEEQTQTAAADIVFASLTNPDGIRLG